MKHTNAKAAAALAALMTAVLLTGCSGTQKAELPRFTDTRSALQTRPAVEAPGYTLVKLSSVQTAAGQEVKENTFTGFVTSMKDLNVRAEPRATSALLGTLPRGSQVAVKATVQRSGERRGG